MTGPQGNGCRGPLPIEVQHESVQHRLASHGTPRRAAFAASFAATASTNDGANEQQKLHHASDLLAAELDRLVQQKLAIAAQDDKLSRDTYEGMFWRNLLVVSLVFVAAVVASVAITRSIVRPIKAAAQLAQDVAAGNLGSRIHVSGNDETAQLLRALTRMNESLADIVGQVRESADSVATGSGEIASGNADLSQRTEEQASNLQQTTAAMMQMGETVQTNARNAVEAAKRAHQAAGLAQQGGAMVEQSIKRMALISETSRRIADIIGTVDGIAFQTNILALNAAVEAARAGEQGRGFAVVAGEVRSLAQRSALAAREIKTLIQESSETVNGGAALIDEVGRTIGSVVSEVEALSGLVQDISAAGQAQTDGIREVGQAIAQIDQTTQQNAALVEESASAAESLRHQATRMAEVVRQFRLE